MNWVLILVAAVIIGFAILGYWKGLLKIVYSLTAWILILVFVTISTPYINNFLRNNTTIYEKTAAHCKERIQQKAGEGMRGQTASAADEYRKFAELGIKLPDSVLDSISEKTAGLADGFMESSGFYEAVSKGMADFLIQGLSSFIAFAIAVLAAIILSGLIGAVSKVPVLSSINRICGLFAGLVYGFLIVWTVF